MTDAIVKRASLMGTASCRPSPADLLEYDAKLAAMDDDAFVLECGSMIYMSAYCGNNPRAIWHWRVDACYDEAKRRGGDDVPLYQRAYNRTARSQGIAV